MADDKAPNPEKSVSSAGSTPPMTSRQAAQRRLLAALLTADRLNGRLNKILSTSAGQERLFAFIQYTSHILHHLLASAPWIALQTRLSLLARLRSSNSRGPSDSASTGKAAAPSTATKKPRLLALSSLMSEARYILRLLDLPTLIAWGSATLKSPPADKTMYALTLLQVLANIIYQALENAAFLTTKGVIPEQLLKRWGGAAKVELWSTRAWLGHIVLQYFVLWRARELRKKAEIEELSEEKQKELKAEVRAWKKSLVNNVCWTPLCLHWSFENGIGFPGPLVGVGSFMAGAWGFADLWASTA
ncbi:hypothetical protein BDW60DRAFT_198293 [Aspergillus nidulans var. acristatus]